MGFQWFQRAGFVGSGGGGLSFGTYGPALPAVSGLTWRWDFDLAYEPLGGMRARIPSRAGLDADAFVHPNSASLDIVAAPGTARRALRFTAAAGSLAQIRRGFTAVDASDAAFTLIVVYHLRAGGADQVVWDCNNGYDSGAGVDTLWRYRLRVASTNATQWGRANGANISAAGPGTPTINATPAVGTRNIFVGRGSLAADTISRAMLNGGSKASSAARSVTNADWDVMLLGGEGVWNGGTSGYQTFQQHADIDIERIALAAGSATDTDLDTLHSWAAGGYV